MWGYRCNSSAISFTQEKMSLRKTSSAFSRRMVTSIILFLSNVKVEVKCLQISSMGPTVAEYFAIMTKKSKSLDYQSA